MTDAARESSAATLARRVEVEWSAERSQRSLSRVHVRRARRRALGKAAVTVSALAVVALVSWFGFGKKSTVAAPAAQALVSASAAKSPKMTFVDGSVARVSEGGELKVMSASPERIESVLTAGAADFEVSKHPERDFFVLAGPVRVRVVGTHFRVERNGERARVSVTEGKVEVQEGDARTYLEAGESRFFPSAIASAAPEEGHATNGSAVRTRFLQLARGGEYKAAYQLMSQTPSAVGSSAEDLMLAADAARLSNHPEQAVGYLRRVTSEHANDSRAPLSAFTLGRVLLSQLSRPGEAAEAFALARRLRPSGSLAEDSLAREAEARAQAGSAGTASSLARQYLSRYPQGKHLPTMQRLATAP